MDLHQYVALQLAAGSDNHLLVAKHPIPERARKTPNYYTMEKNQLMG